MLLYLACWLVLIPLAYLIGIAVPATRSVARPGDRSILAVWLGLVALGSGLLALSLVLPLTSPAVPVLGIGVAAGALVLPGVRREVRTLRDRASPLWLGTAALLLMVAALIAGQHGPTGDVGLYHYQLIKWMAEYGSVPGLALLHMRFGTSSSWFALHAPFEWGPLEGRVDALGGTLVLWLVGMHLTIAVSRLLRGRGTRTDRFLAAGYLLLVPYLGSRHATSSYLFIPLSALLVVIASLLLGGGGKTRMDAGWRPALRPAALLPALLAAGAVTIKLNALPVLVVAAAFFVVREGRSYRVLRAGLLASGVLLLPILVNNLVTSGCLLYPSDVICLGLPWTADTAAAAYQALAQSWARVGSETSPDFWTWLRAWVAEQPWWALTLVAVFAYGAWIVARDSKRIALTESGRAWIAVLALFGLAFTFFTAPDPRFMIPYIGLLPALFVADVAPRVWKAVRHRVPASIASAVGRVRLAGRRVSVAMAALVFAAAVLVPQPVLNVRSALSGDIGNVVDLSDVGWLVPKRPVPSDIPVIERRAGDLVYYEPEECCRCWAAELPCTPYLTVPDVRLRDAGRGLRGGFVSGEGDGASR